MWDWMTGDGYSKLKEEVQHLEEWQRTENVGNVESSNLHEAENRKKKIDEHW